MGEWPGGEAILYHNHTHSILPRDKGGMGQADTRLWCRAAGGL